MKLLIVFFASEGNVIVCGRSVLDELCQTGGAERTGMLGRCARAARRVVFARGACAPWAAAFEAPTVGMPLRVDGALIDPFQSGR